MYIYVSICTCVYEKRKTSKENEEGLYERENDFKIKSIRIIFHAHYQKNIALS